MLIVKGIVFVLFFSIATLPGALCAQGPAGSGAKTSYAVLKAGSFFPESSDMDKQDADKGFTGQVGFGYYLNPYFSLEAAVGYMEFKGRQANVDRKYNLIPLEVSGKLGLPLGGLLEPYLAVGVGGYYVKAKAGNLEETSTRAGFFGGGGVNLNLGETFFIGVEARYLVLTAPAPTATPYSNSGTTNINLDGITVTGNLGFRF